MNETTYNVRVWAIEVREGKTGKTYAVRWSVAGRRHKRSHITKALADSFRSDLMAAARRGENFDVDSGMPISAARQATQSITWYAFASEYVDIKWPDISPKHRKGIAEALVAATPAMLRGKLDDVDAKAMRSALLNWGFNVRRNSPECPQRVVQLLRLAESRSVPLGNLTRPEVIRAVLTLLSTRLDGSPAAGSTVTVKRANLSSAFGYAVERGYLPTHPMASVKWRAPRVVEEVDRRSVVNPEQAKRLLETVAELPRSGAKLVGFFGALYYAGLRPEEAVNLRLSSLDLPTDGVGWGWIHLERAAPEVDKQWSDDGLRRSERQLKHRARGEGRRVPCAPALVALLSRHVELWPPDGSELLFRGERGAPLAGVTYSRMWQRARAKVLTPEQFRSSLVRRPYDLRHAAVSTWLSSGVDPVQVASWAGHSVAILLRVYAKCIEGGETLAMEKIERALNN